MNIYCDGHCDTLKLAFDENKDLNFEKYDFNIINAKNNNPVIQNLAVFVHTDFENGFESAKNILEYYYSDISDISLITNKKTLEYVINSNSIGAILSIENGKAIENNLDNIDYFYRKGIKIMGITWNDENLLGSGCFSENDNGLTDFGIAYVKQLEKNNILIDISHTSEKTFWDTMENTNQTIIATHSNCYNICNHQRNLKDNQIKAIAERNGIIGICFASPFLRKSGIASVEDVVKHIEHIINLVGIDYVGFGSDFDGLNEENKMQDIKGIKDVKIIENSLKKLGYSQNNINKIMGQNWMRVLNKVLE
ncbi:MAG: dipeptidase [Clostridia bacterium]|nr:dipeptidase [Clostridia bacterium]